MSNLHSADEPVDFWVWVDPGNWLVRHQITETGGFTSGGFLPGGGKSNLMFIPNPDFTGDVTPFHLGVMNSYIAEYNLELGRNTPKFRQYPSRLDAIFLFRTEDEAHRYREHHPEHVARRILKHARSVTRSVFSDHDSAWVDFLRQSHSVDAESVAHVNDAYWSGRRVVDHKLLSRDAPWTQDPIIETLFIGRVEFPDRSLDV